MGTPIRPEVPLSPAEQLRRAQERPAGVSPAEQLRQAHDLARPMDQSQSARVLRLQGQTAFPTDFVERNLDALEKQVSEPDFDADRFWKESPNVAQWLAQDPARVGATGRDIQRMGSVERYLRAIGSEFERNKITIQLSEPTLAAMAGRATPEQEAEITRLRQRQSELPQLGPEGFIAGIPVATIGQLPILFELYKGSAVGGVVGAATGVATAAIAGQLGPQVAVPEELATIPAAAARGFYLGTRAGVAVEGMKLSMAEAFLDYREMEGVSREDAATGALIAGAIAGSLEVIPFGEAAQRIPALRRFGRDGIREMLAAPSTRALLRRAAGHLVAQGLAEGGTEGAQALIQHIGGVLTQRIGDGTIANTDAPTLLREMFGDAEAWGDILAEARAGAQAGVGFGAAVSAPTTAIDYRGARRAEQNAARMRQAVEAIHGNDRDGAMAMAKDAPEAMRQAVASMNAEGGFYDVSAWSAYWQSQQTATGEAADPRQVALALGVEPEAYDAAVASGAPINVPADRLLVDAMGSKTHQEWLVNNLRSTPNEMSKAEADAMRQDAERSMEEVSETEGNARVVEADEAVAAFAERLTEQLRSTKMVAGDVAQNVTLWSEAARTAIASNPDIPVADVMRRFEQVQVTALPVAVDATGRAVSAYEVTNEMVTREDGVQVPLLRSTRTAQTQLAKQERRLAERYQGDESRMPEREREQLAQARQSVADANAVNSQLVPFPTIAELQGLRQGQGEPSPRMDAIRRMIAETRNRLDPSLTPEQRAAFAVYLNADVLEQAAFHGTPHEIKDRFRLDKIGTGEGAQAYGWGLYFAQALGVAEGYRKQLSGAVVKAADGTPLADALVGDAEALKILGEAEQDTDLDLRDYAQYLRTTARTSRDYAALGSSPDANLRNADAAEKVASLFESGAVAEKSGNLYQVDIPDAAVATYLDWDKSLLSLPKATKDAIRKVAKDLGFEDFKISSYENGEEFYREVTEHFVMELGLATPEAQKPASLALLSAGIRGIKYLDGGSRAQPDGTRNLVVFDESDVTITHRNGEPVTAQERTDFLAQEGMQGETLGETIDVDGVSRPTTNSTGQPIHPTAEGVRNFYRWFGSSKVVDEQGRPLVVYHGTTATGLNEFKSQAELLGTEAENANAVIYASPNPDYAALYARGENANIVPVYLKIESPRTFAPRADGSATTKSSLFSAEQVAEMVEQGFDGVMNEAAMEMGVFSGTQVKSALGNSGAFGPSADILKQTTPENEPRGAFIADPTRSPSGARVDGPRLVAMFKERNQSTFLHESAHAFLDIWATLADDPRADPAFKQRVVDLKGELGAAPDATLTEAQEEAFAGMFLDFAKSGVAPSEALRVAFASFGKWLSRLWSILKGEIVPASPKVRDLLNRMLATDEAIEEAQGLYMAPLFPDDAAINEAFVKARTEAEGKTRAEAMLTIRRAEQEWWKRESKQVMEEVAQTIHADPAYIARQALTALENTDGSPLASDHPLRQKLNREQVVALLGAEATKQLPRGKAGAVYSTTGGGVELSVAAQILGYDNATEMLDAIRSTRPMDEQIEAVTDATMRETYGDPMTDGSIPEVAIETLHNASLDRMRQLEMEAILRDHPEAFRDAIIRAASRPLNVRELKAWATERIASRTLESLRPQEYLSAERKAQKEAIQAVSKAQWANAVQAKSRQRAAAALYAEAIAVREEMDKAKKLFGKVWGPDEKIAKNRNFDLVNAARAILANYGVGKRGQEAKVYLGQMAEYDPQTAEDIRPLIDETLQLVPPRDAFKKLTVAEAQFVHEAVRAVWAQSKEAEQITIEGKKVAIQDAIEPMVLAMEAKPDVMDGAGIDRRTEFADKANRGLLTARAAGRRVESWVDLMDGGDINGPFRRALFTRIREATALKGQQTRDILTQYEGMLQVVRPFLGTAEIAAKELGTGRWVWKDTAHLLGAMLHTGNPSNFERLLAGRGWTMDQWVAMRERLIADGTLRPEHFDFVQGVWDLFEAMKPEAQKVHRRMFGRYFAEITREAFTIRFPDGTEKEYAGGYTPASKDPDASGAAAQRQAESFLEEAYGMRFPTVTKGFTMSRVQNREPLLLSLDIVTKHIDGVQKFVHLAEPVREVGRIFRNKEFRAAFDRVDPTLINEMLLPWLERTSTQRVEKPFNPFIDAAAKYLRGTAGAAFMFLNVRNALEQVTSLSTAALRVDRKYLLLATANEVQDPKAITELITQHSPYMADLVTTKVMDVARSVDKIVTQPSVFQTTQNFMAEHAYVLQVTFQDRLNRTVWYGSYLESTDKGMSVQEAVRKADADVRLTQGSFEAVDVSRIETGTPIWRAVAMFAGYFNMLANLNATEMQKAVDTMGLKKSMPKLLNVYVLGFAIPILFSGALRQAFRGFADVDGDDEWGYLDDFLAFFFGEQAKAATAMVPAAGQSVNYLIGLFDSQPMNDRISVSPAVSFLEGAGRGVKAQYDILRGDDLGRRDIRDILSFYSLMTRVPLTGFAPPATYLYDVESGRARPSGPIDFTRGLISGQPGQR